MRAKRICPNCGHEGRGLWIRPGSGALEGLGYLCFIVPGLLYSLWRSSHAYRGIRHERSC
jgi:hypothetical protein